MEKDYKIIDNVLPKEEFSKIQSWILGSSFPWYFQDCVAEDNQEYLPDFYFAHLLYNTDTGEHSPFFKLCEPILAHIPSDKVFRIKANLYPNVGKYKENRPHVDFPFTHRGAIFYINTNDGYTILDDGTKIESKENRLLLFNSEKPHSSTHCTDKKARININFNFY